MLNSGAGCQAPYGLTPTVLMQTLTGIAAGSWLIAAGLLTLVTSPLTTGGPDRKESHDRR